MGAGTMLDSLRNHAFTAGMSDAQIASLAELAREVRFEDDETVLVDGQRSRLFYLVVAGSVAVELQAPNYAVCVQAVGPGEAFGWSSLLEDQDTLFRVRARERTQALCFHGPSLAAKCKDDPALGEELLRRV